MPMNSIKVTPLASVPQNSSLAEAQAACRDAEHQLRELQAAFEQLVTERTDALRQSEQLHRIAFDLAPAGMAFAGLDERFTKVNETLCEITGYTAAELIGMSCADLTLPEDLARDVELQAAFRNGSTTKYANEKRYVRKDGGIRWVSTSASMVTNVGAQPLHSIRVVRDITERKEAGNRMRISEVRYRRLFEAAHDGVLLLDPATCKITDANPFMTTLLGYTREQLVGKELFEIGLLKDEAASREMFEKLKLEREVRYEDLPLESKEGEHQDVEVVANVYDEDGHSVIQCNIRDITARKQAEAAQHRLDVLTTSNEKLEQAIIQRQMTEAALRQSEQHQKQLLEQSHEMQEQLRQLSREVLQAQEDERKRISRELHDVIAQTLSGINLRLALLQSDSSTKDLQEKITQTQHLVAQSVDTVHRFARDLRPAMLDDLGLIPALHSHLKDFTQQSGILVALQAQAEIEELDCAGRTVLYRVTQEALTNVVRHAKASRVEMTLQKFSGIISLEIKDNGQGFEVDGKSCSTKNNRLGLLGMRERVEMINGTFNIDSKPGGPTTIRVEIPVSTSEPLPSFAPS